MTFDAPTDLDSVIGCAFDAARVGLSVTDERGRILRINPEITRMFGLTAEEVVGHTYYILVPRANRRSAMRATRAVLQGKELPQPDWHVRLRDGRHIWVRVTPKLIVVDGRKYVLSVLDDVTDPRETAERATALSEELEVANEQLEEMVTRRTIELQTALAEMESFNYSVSHDLRAPLRAMSGASHILMQDFGDTLPAEAKAELTAISRAANRLARLIDDLLAYSRLGRADLRRQPINVSEIAEEIAQSLRTATSAHATIVVEPGLMADADEPMLRVLLQNLLDNALKYSGKEDRPQIEVRSVETAHGLALCVRDNGIGFDSAYSDKLFQPFQRLHRDADYPGTGIGLANVRRIVERHGGRVWAEGCEDEGAAFYFTLN
jgi:PAS domain S-box-containing protein